MNKRTFQILLLKFELFASFPVFQFLYFLLTSFQFQNFNQQQNFSFAPWKLNPFFHINSLFYFHVYKFSVFSLCKFYVRQSSTKYRKQISPSSRFFFLLLNWTEQQLRLNSRFTCFCSIPSKSNSISNPWASIVI